MNLPKSFKIGHRAHRVEVQRRAKGSGRFDGAYCHMSGKITLHTHGVDGRPLTARRRSHVFWHEVTHAILHHMKHPQWRDEKFVDGFAKRLNRVIRSARF